MGAHDLIVIGGGSGGVATARRAAKHGAKVLLIEGGAIGGTCVNVGCVPKKVLWNASVVKEAFDLSEGYGLGTNHVAFDYPRLKAGRDAYIARLNAIYDQNLSTAGVERVNGWAKFLEPTVCSVEGREYRAPHILIATGGQPRRPNLPGRELLSTSDDFFAWDTIPAKVAVVGAGYIAVELAGVLHALGAEVEIFLRGDRVLRHFDAELALHLMEEMRGHGIKFHTNTDLRSVAEQDGALALETTTGRRHGFGKVIAAIGRAPRTDLDLAKAGVKLNDDGYIVVDAYQNTTQAGIYAVGDVTGHVELTPVAIAAGRRLAERLFNNRPDSKLDYGNIASVVFSHPPLGTVGLTEEQAKKAYGDSGVTVHRSKFTNMYYSLGAQKPKTLMKIVTRTSDDRILGMHVLGMGADEMIQGFAVAVKMGATKADLDATVAIHPTAAEEFVTM